MEIREVPEDLPRSGRRQDDEERQEDARRQPGYKLATERENKCGDETRQDRAGDGDTEAKPSRGRTATSSSVTSRGTT